MYSLRRCVQSEEVCKVCVSSPVQAELGDMDAWQEDPSAWEDESSDAAWEAEEVLR